jgi:hypothetical protein
MIKILLEIKKKIKTSINEYFHILTMIFFNYYQVSQESQEGI